MVANALDRRAFVLTLGAGLGYWLARSFARSQEGFLAPSDPEITDGAEIWAQTLESLGRDHARSLAALAEDLLPCAPFQFPTSTTNTISRSEAECLRRALLNSETLAYHRRGLDALSDYAKAHWHELPPTTRAAHLHALLDIEEDSTDRSAVAGYLISLRDELETAYWQSSAIRLRLGELAATGAV